MKKAREEWREDKRSHTNERWISVDSSVWLPTSSQIAKSILSGQFSFDKTLITKHSVFNVDTRPDTREIQTQLSLLVVQKYSTASFLLFEFSFMYELTWNRDAT